MASSHRVIRWLHLSDIHMGKDIPAQNQMIDKLISHVQSTPLRPDIIFITGDIANKGNESEYHIFLESFMKRLHQLLAGIHGEEKANMIFIIPGNHDVAQHEDKLAWEGFRGELKNPDKKNYVLDPTAEGLKLRRGLLNRFRAYEDAEMHQYTPVAGNWIASEEGFYTQMLDFDGFRVGILGLNTAWASGATDEKEGQTDRDNMTPGEEMVTEGLKRLSREEPSCHALFVLGHHAISWFHEKEREGIVAEFRNHHVVYLNGDQHEARVSEVDGGAFLTMQAGALFQDREDKAWVNRFWYGELHIDKWNITVHPFKWSKEDKKWVADNIPGSDDDNHHPDKTSTIYTFCMPGYKPEPVGHDHSTSISVPITITIPEKLRQEGWQHIDKAYLASLPPIDNNEILRYFDGRNPNWRYALARQQIPRRLKVSEILSALEKARVEKGTHVFGLLSGGGEGKSTVLRQVVCDLVEEHDAWNVLYYQKSAASLALSEMVGELPPGVGVWLLVADDAEWIVGNVFQAIDTLDDLGRRDVHFLLCCRDTDWMRVNGHRLSWDAHGARYKKVTLNGLQLEDAREIVEHWGRLGKAGMADLYGKSVEQAATQLVKKAKQELTNRDRSGSFLGAMLQVRYERSMRDHVRELLKSLNHNTPISNTKGQPLTLLYAYAHIAALHAINFFGLTDEILAKALECGLEELEEHVISPLGLEAAIDTDPPGEIAVDPFSSLILTRHRTIAEETIKQLKEFGRRLDLIAEHLLRAAISVLRPHKSALSMWRTLPSRFFEEGEQSSDKEFRSILIATAIRLGNIWIIEEPKDVIHVTFLAKFYRDSGDPEGPAKATGVFRDSYSKLPRDLKDKIYYHDWATAQERAGNYYTSIWLNSISLDDDTPSPERNNKYSPEELAKIAFNGLSIVFGKIYQKYRTPLFGDAWIATTELGLACPIGNETSGTDRVLQGNKQKIGQFSELQWRNREHLEWLDIVIEAIKEAWMMREEPQLPLKTPDKLSLKRLRQLISQLENVDR